MMKPTVALAALFCVLVLTGCERKPDDEQQGQQMLTQARYAYIEHDYDAARDTILSLRRRFPMALEARRQAILLMDSIELMDAQGDSLKTEFFRRKLEHDKLNIEGLADETN